MTAILLALLMLLGCQMHKPPKTVAPKPKAVKTIADALYTASQYSIPQRLPDLWEGIKETANYAERICPKRPEDCKRLSRLIKNAVLKGIEIVSQEKSPP